MFSNRLLSPSRTVVLLSSMFICFQAQAAGLADSGLADCDRGSGIMEACEAANVGDSATLSRQDARYGQDAYAFEGLYQKIGAGDAGFDYTKIANNGTVLAATAVLGTGADQWACTKDNITDLMWEVKTTSGLRNRAHTYTWYDSNAGTNGGDAGLADSGAAVGSDNCSDAARCDTEKYVADVNASSLCSYNDWRVPTVRELISILHGGKFNTKVDTNYFPSMQTSAAYWTANTYVPALANAWTINFYPLTQLDVGVNNQANILKSSEIFVILVRGNAF